MGIANARMIALLAVFVSADTVVPFLPEQPRLFRGIFELFKDTADEAVISSDGSPAQQAEGAIGAGQAMPVSAEVSDEQRNWNS